MPNQPKTKARSVRVPEDLWQAAKVRAEEKGENVSDVILRALRRYVTKASDLERVLRSVAIDRDRHSAEVTRLRAEVEALRGAATSHYDQDFPPDG